jgi:hypothetical protein
MRDVAQRLADAWQKRLGRGQELGVHVTDVNLGASRHEGLGDGQSYALRPSGYQDALISQFNVHGTLSFSVKYLGGRVRA